MRAFQIYLETLDVKMRYFLNEAFLSISEML